MVDLDAGIFKAEALGVRVAAKRQHDLTCNELFSRTCMGNKKTIVRFIDRFKNINDKFGHDIGDAVLITVANILGQSKQVQEVYRLGGEEFIILLKNMDHQQVSEEAEKIRQAIEDETFHSHQEDIKLTVSIGISSLQPEQEFNDFLRAADEKLYQAKREGRNKVCF